MGRTPQFADRLDGPATKRAYLLGGLMKRIWTWLFGIWLAGVVVATLFYEFQLRTHCIRDEGFLKGVFWCSKQAFSAPGQVVQYGGFLIKGLFWPVTLVTSFGQSEKTFSDWAPLPKGSPFTIGTTALDPPSDGSRIYFLVEFNSRRKCAPELSLMGFQGDAVGDPVLKQQPTNGLSVAIAGAHPRVVPAISNSYTNGFELAAFVDSELLNDMAKGSSIQIVSNDMGKSWKFSLRGFKLVSDEQIAACVAKGS